VKQIRVFFQYTALHSDEEVLTVDEMSDEEITDAVCNHLNETVLPPGAELEDFDWEVEDGD
jgi:hypothetical protein